MVAFPRKPENVSKVVSTTSCNYPLSSHGLMNTQDEKVSKSTTANGSENGALKLKNWTGSGGLVLVK